MYSATRSNLVGSRGDVRNLCIELVSASMSVMHFNQRKEGLLFVDVPLTAEIT